MTARAARDDSRTPVVEAAEPIGPRPAATHPAPHLPGGGPARKSGCPAPGHGSSATGHLGHCRTAHPAAGPGVDETAARALRAVHVETAVPVHNEQDDLPRAVQTLHGYLAGQFPFRTLVTIAGNGSIDRTYKIAASLAARLPGVRLVRIEQPGRDCAPGPLLRVEPCGAQLGGTVLHHD